MLKKIVLTITIILFSLSILSAEEIKVYFNGKLLSFTSKPVEKNGRIFVPVNDLVKEMKGDVSWDSPSQNVIILAGDREIKFRTCFKQARVNSQWVPLDMGAIRIEGKVFVPLRFLAETMGADIKWDKESLTAFIKYTMPSDFQNIFEITHNGGVPLIAGETFVATFMGPDKGKVFIKIISYEDNSVFFTVPMEEKSEGLYEALYEVKEGDVLRGGKVIVTCIDEEGNKSYIKADEDVYINTLGPVIKKVSPGENGFAYEDINSVYIVFDLKEGSTIDGTSVFFSFNDIDVSSQILITDNIIIYKFTPPLKIGENSVKFSGSDRGGNKIEKNWNFWVVSK